MSHFFMELQGIMCDGDFYTITAVNGPRKPFQNIHLKSKILIWDTTKFISRYCQLFLNSCSVAVRHTWFRFSDRVCTLLTEAFLFCWSVLTHNYTHIRKLHRLLNILYMQRISRRKLAMQVCVIFHNS